MQKYILIPVSKVMACNSSWQFRPDVLILPVQEPLVPVCFSNHTLSQAEIKVSLILNYLFLFQPRLKSSLHLAFYTENKIASSFLKRPATLLQSRSVQSSLQDALGPAMAGVGSVDSHVFVRGFFTVCWVFF